MDAERESYLERAAVKLEQHTAKYGIGTWKGSIHYFLWNLSQLFRCTRRMRPKNDDCIRIAFILKGGLGDQLMSLNFIQNLDQYIDCQHEIDVCTSHRKGTAMLETFCSGQAFVRKVVDSTRLDRSYDCVVSMVRMPKIVYWNEQKIARLSPKFSDYCKSVTQFAQANAMLYRSSTQADAIAMGLTRFMGRNRLQQGDVNGILGVKSIFSLCPQADSSKVLACFELQGIRYITIQRGVGGPVGNASTRNWPLANYTALVRMINEKYPDLPVIQLGVTQAELIHGTHDLRGKTNLTELMILLKCSCCHIDIDGGQVHMRHFLQGKPSVVLFGPTSDEFLGYSENINIRVSACQGPCEWLTADYEKNCIKGTRECMNSITPSCVFSSVEKLLAGELQNVTE
ncbi:MAG: glycosyltransferase family 9 protein [Planctomycetia bacterium]|nr:glycosyltransferase family 9 protein [Planctomycetia bacterium]